MAPAEVPLPEARTKGRQPDGQKECTAGRSAERGTENRPPRSLNPLPQRIDGHRRAGAALEPHRPAAPSTRTGVDMVRYMLGLVFLLAAALAVAAVFVAVTSS